MINTTLLISLISLTFLSIITPGPSNLIVMSSSALFGWRRTIPMFLGISTGSALMVSASVYGLGAIIKSWPWLLIAIKLLGAAWLTNMSVQFFKKGLSNNSQKQRENQSNSIRPFHFYEGIFMQWANPKAIIVALTIAASFIDVSETPFQSLIIILGVFIAVGIPTASVWLFLGNLVNKMVTEEKYAKKFNLIMGGSILLTAIMILLA
ncbi:LysE family translocator [Woeseiaceae bacterium]|nr:LysE family translocator [Woeseiaceae bacterium]